MISKCIFMPRDWAMQRSHSPESVMVSITNPGDDKVILGLSESRILRLQFRDLKKPDPSADTFSSIQAQAVREFLNRWNSSSQKIEFLVHCRAGQSRSAAIAQWAADALVVPVVGEPSDIGTRLANPLVLDLLERSAKR
jgi:predicted protein tyrosine phosphatase